MMVVVVMEVRTMAVEIVREPVRRVARHAVDRRVVVAADHVAVRDRLGLRAESALLGLRSPASRADDSVAFRAAPARADAQPLVVR
jgi:hypothetical protein